MNRNAVLENTDSLQLFQLLYSMHYHLDGAFAKQFDRSLPFADTVFDRWERAKKLGFGEGSSIYDNSYVFGNVAVGKNTWVGPYTIIDGSGGLSIGDNCTIAAGVHIYTHDNVGQTLTGGQLPIQREAVAIGNCSYIGPNAILGKGITIGSHCIVGANSFVNASVSDYLVVAGSPAKVIGRVHLTDAHYSIEYFSAGK
jgi:acetyltransferase-like isoleucine patch superfamily enzyme